MSNPSRKLGRALLALAVTIVAVLAVAQPADAGKAEDLVPQRGLQVYTDTVGTHHSVRALQPAEIEAKGLALPNTKLVVVAPQISVDKVGAPKLVVPDQTSASVQSCWDHSWWQGTYAFGGLYGQTDVTWCASGGFVTYTWKNCWGHDGGYPTYEYLGCSMSETYGVDWTAWDV